MEVLAPDGRTWTVRRRWVPRLRTERTLGRLRHRLRGTASRAADGLDAASGLPDLLDDGPFFAIGAVVVVVLTALVAIPVLIVVLDIAVVAVAAVIGLAARTLGWHPWAIDAVATDTTGHWRISGWRASREHVARVATALREGVELPS